MPRKFLCLVFLLTMVLCCSHIPKKTANRPTLRLTIFDCGEILVRDISIFSPGVDKGKDKKLINSCYLIEHPKGRLIWDTGLSDELALELQGKDDGKFHLAVKKPFLKALVENSVQISDIDYLGLSHFHLDHIGNAMAFKNATILVQKEEYAAAFTPEAAKSGMDPKFLDFLRVSKVQQLQGDHDVFGDGSVVIKSTPGHTSGHQSLYVQLAKTGPILLTGDLYHFTKNRQYKRVPSFNVDKKVTLESMAAFEKFAQEKKAQVWIQHDLEQNQKLPHAPDFFE